MRNNKYAQQKEAARAIAIEWQSSEYGADRAMYYSECADAGEYFTALANRYGLMEEFEENGIPVYKGGGRELPPMYITTDRNASGAWILQASGRGFDFPRRVYYFNNKAQALKNYREEFGLKGARLTEVQLY